MTTLEELERLLKAGTPGPWETWEREARSNCWEIGTPEDHVADLFYCREEDHAYIPWDEARASSNAALIVAAINALPGLLESARRVEEMRAALAFYADPANHIGYPDPNAKVYIETSAIDRDGGNRARALIAGVAIEDRFVQIGWTNEAQISYVTLDGEGSIYPDTQEGCDVPVYRAALKGT
jgi:hypothetical protein